MRGEHFQIPVIQLTIAGSPPHARGAHNHPVAENRAPGITPACAGSTVNYQPESSPAEDHPRMRGEHLDYGGQR